MLPTPRVFLTSLINNISAIPASTITTTDSGPDNPLKGLTSTHRALLSTLHVLFPNNIFLPALDLLDRGLVTRLVQVEENAREVLENPTAVPPQGPANLSTIAPALEVQKNALYQVRSAQQPRSRFNQSISASVPVYIVRLDAWSCSCAAFTFSAFPASSGLFQPCVSGKDEDAEIGGEEDWQFGGMSLGTGGDEIPCCKHLLACLLGEKWNAVLGSYVTVRKIGRAEMAGIGAES